MHNGNILLSGSSLDISDIGVQPNERSEVESTLICVTSNVNNQCCRSSDGGNVGEWWNPNGALVIRDNLDTSNSIFTRVGYQEQVQLSRRSDATGPVGRYTCAVPSSRGDTMTAYIIITGETRITSITATYLPICDSIWETDRIVRKPIIAYVRKSSLDHEDTNETEMCLTRGQNVGLASNFGWWRHLRST